MLQLLSPVNKEDFHFNSNADVTRQRLLIVSRDATFLSILFKPILESLESEFESRVKGFRQVI